MARPADPPPPHPAATPADFAVLASEGRWKLAPHLALLNRLLMELAFGDLEFLIVAAPPRHGKSQLCSEYFPAYFLGVYPDDWVILTAYSDEFASDWGAKAQAAVAGYGAAAFGISVDPKATAAGRWKIAGHRGGMYATGLGGSLVGRGAKILILDDPIKNAEEALSEAERNRAWNWLVSTALTRLEPGGRVLVMMQRWHEDDLVGRLIAMLSRSRRRWRYLRLPALAEDEDDPLGRAPGEPLWPERFPREVLEAIRDGQADDAQLGASWWDAQYQGNPVPRTGGMFPRDWFTQNLVPSAPRRALRCRFWDLAASDGKGDYTVGTLMAAETGQGPFYIEHIVRGRWGVEETDRRVLATAERDARQHGAVAIRKEQEPGAAGKREAIGFVKMLAGYDVAFEPNSGSKEDRARPLASQCAVGNVKVANPAAWEGCTFAEFLAEFAAFPGRGKHDDICDSVAGSFNAVALGGEPPGPCHVAGTAAALYLPGGFGMAPLF